VNGQMLLFFGIEELKPISTFMNQNITAQAKPIQNFIAGLILQLPEHPRNCFASIHHIFHPFQA